jgi:hypothetical protein
MKNILLSILLILFSFTAYSFDKGVGVNPSNKDTLWDTSLPYAIARQGLRSASSDEYIVAFQDLESYVFGLTDTARVIKVIKEGRSLLGNWPLSRWQSEPIETEVLNRYLDVRRSYPALMLEPSKPLGCLAQNPLRYGDIEKDGQNELVIFIGNDLFVFSPQHEKIVFMLKTRVDDWLTIPETAEHYEYYPSARPHDLTPYYQSAANIDYSEAIPGYRGYGKIYVKDFDGNGASDIVVWRKLYLSKLLSEPVAGFDKVSDTYYHYERKVTGEYELKTDTAPETIQGWLTAKNQTWQSGFPSKSECAGQEGQLIPEMHDPLLNDPDVLK